MPAFQTIFIIILGYCSPQVFSGFLRANVRSDRAEDVAIPAEICETKECVQAAATLLENMDENADPCTNFYDFACGRFVANTMIPDDQSQVTIFDTLQGKLIAKLRKILEAPLNPWEPKSFQLVKNYYASCVNKTRIEEEGISPLARILKTLGGWPVVEGDAWNETAFNWIHMLYSFRHIGLSIQSLFEFSIVVDKHNATRKFLSLDQPRTGILRDHLLKGFDDPVFNAYFKYMVSMAVLLGADKSRAESELAEALKLEQKIANKTSMAREEDLQNLTSLYHYRTIQQLQQTFKYVDWLEYINTMLAPGAQVNKDEIVVVAVPVFLHNLGLIISTTPKRDMANYLLWRAIASTVYYLDDRTRDILLEFLKVSSGIGEREQRWTECAATALGSNLDLALGALYVRRYFDKESKQQAVNMLETILQTFYGSIDKVDWMDGETKQSAKGKAKNMTYTVGYPDELLDNRMLDQVYNSLELNQYDFLLNVLNLSKNSMDYWSSRIRIPHKRTSWVTHGAAATINAFNMANENTIDVPAGILQGEFYSANRPNYLNFGAIGMVIGHEISHSFDEQGSQYNDEGAIRNWWNPETKQAYLNRTRCFTLQYGNYSISNIGARLNGAQVQGEAIADNIGIKHAYLAYQTWAESRPPEQVLPGFRNFTQNQLFWLGAANVWCAKYRNEALKSHVLSMYHPPAEQRIVGAFSNMEYFSNDFNCPLGSPMNPTNKCVIW